MKNFPALVEAGAVEAKTKHVGLGEGVRSFIQFAHEMKEYNPDELAKIYPALSFLSTKVHETPAQILRASGYHIPATGELGVDPIQEMVLQIAMERAGVTNTKSGTWLREMARRAIPDVPGTVSDKELKKHNQLLKDFGLTDESGKPTWFDAAGKPDEFKMLDIVRQHADQMDPVTRMGKERALFGAQGQGAIGVLADPKVFSQLRAMDKEARAYNPSSYMAGALQFDPIEQFNKGWLDVQKVLIDIGGSALPSVVSELQLFDGVLKAMTGTFSALPDWLKSSLKKGVEATNPAVGVLDTAKGFFNWFAPPAHAEGAPPALGPATPSGFDDRFGTWPEKQSYNVIPPPKDNKPIVLTANFQIDGQTLGGLLKVRLRKITSFRIPRQLLTG